jgi:hypothetical protein
MPPRHPLDPPRLAPPAGATPPAEDPNTVIPPVPPGPPYVDDPRNPPPAGSLLYHFHHGVTPSMDEWRVDPDLLPPNAPPPSPELSGACAFTALWPHSAPVSATSPHAQDVLARATIVYRDPPSRGSPRAGLRLAGGAAAVGSEIEPRSAS